MKKVMFLFSVLCIGLLPVLGSELYTLYVWDFENTYTDGSSVLWAPDVDNSVGSLNRDLRLDNATVVSPGYGGSGSAIDVGIIAANNRATWGFYDNIQVEAKFKLDNLASASHQYIIEIAAVFRLYVAGGTNMMTLTVWDSQNEAKTINTEIVLNNDWQSVMAYYSPDGLMRVETDAGAKQSTFGTGRLRVNTGGVNISVGSYRDQYQIDGYMDDVKISTWRTTDWMMPHEDSAGTVKALWHFDNLADPNVTGSAYEKLPDDDSDNPGRDSFMYPYSANVRQLVGATGGPSLVDPSTYTKIDSIATAVGYPAGNAAFGNAAFFDDPVLVESDTYRSPHTELVIDRDNLMAECWIRPADNIVSLSAHGTAYFVFDRWSQFAIRTIVLNGAFQAQGMVWTNAVATFVGTMTLPQLGLSESDWLHLRLVFYKGDTAFYINGYLAHRLRLATEILDEMASNRNTTFIGSRYNPQNYYWGYIDEMKISQAVYDVQCGAWGYLPGDLNEDCVIDELDLQILAEQWLETTEPSDPLATEGVIPQYESYNIPLAVTTPTIDGTLSAGEWADATTVFLGMPELITPPNRGIYTPKAGATEYPTHENLSVTYFFKWDYEHLYVGLEVHDDVLIFDDGYPDDHANLAFNLLRAGTSRTETTFYNMYRDYFGNTIIRNQSGFNTNYNPVNAIAASALQSYGWSYEVALKWSDFGGYVPTIGDVHGTVLMINDNDAADGVRDTMLWDSGTTDEFDLYKYAILTAGLVCGDIGYFPGDVNFDCDVNLLDYADLAVQWLDCSTPGGDDCVDARF